MAKPKNPRPDIGRRLAELMAESADLQTQTALEKRTKVPQSTIGRILRGETNPSIEVLGRLAAALGTSTDYLSTGKGSRTVQAVSPASQTGRPDGATITNAQHALLRFLRRRDPDATLDLTDPADAQLFAGALDIIQGNTDPFDASARVMVLVEEYEAKRRGRRTGQQDGGAARGKARKAVPSE